MFSKDTKAKSGSDAGDAAFSGGSQAISATPSIISADLQITGNLKSNGDIQIDGKIEGDVNSKSLTIGEGAEVKGTIRCERVRVCGQVSGEIRATSIVLARSARVNGDIAHRNLEIEAGASLEGGVRRLDKEAASGGKSKAGKAESSSVTKISEAASPGSSSASTNGSAAAL